MNERNLVDLFLNQAKNFGERTVLRVKQGGRYRDISWNEFRDQVSRIALALDDSGVQKGDRVALLSENRSEWAYVDLAILAVGAVTVPVYPTASLNDVQHILNHCEAKILFVSSQEQLARIAPIQGALTAIRKMIVFDSVQATELIITLADFIQKIEFRGEGRQVQFQALVRRVGLDDLATIIYTSGTTGPAKGVMLTHRNFLVNCYDAKKALPISERDTFISFLPLSHVFERMAGYYLALLCGCTIAYAENMNTVPQNLVEVKPTVGCAVPRFFEKMYGRIQTQVEEGGALKRMIFSWAVRIGRSSSAFRMSGKQLPFLLGLQFWLAKKLVYAKIYARLGGRLRCFISGSAPLSKELAEFFYSVGILVLEGYGLTETSPVISANRFERFKFGSVGLALENVQVRLGEGGEILAKGPSIMKGYYKDEKATQEAIVDGWFHTGDLGRMDEDGFLYITGRKKDIIKTSGGKIVSPQNIENAILADPIFSQVILVGDKHHFVTALVVPNFERVKNLLKAKDQSLGETPEELVQSPLVHQLIRDRIDERTKDLASYEKIKYFTLFAREFSQEKGELTSTLKIKRPMLVEHFHDAIERMYRDVNGPADEGRDRIFFVL